MAIHAHEAPGARLARLRYDAGLSREALARETGLAVKTIERIERGESNPQPKTAKLIADRLGASPSELFPQEQAA